MEILFAGNAAGAQQGYRSLRADHGDPGRDGGTGTRRTSRFCVHRKCLGAARATGRVPACGRGPPHPASAGASRDDELQRASDRLQAGGREGRQSQPQIPAMRSISLQVPIGKESSRGSARQKAILRPDIVDGRR